MRKATAHLTDEEFALYADAIILNSSDRLPNKILRHVMECNRCKKELMELLNLIEEQESHTSQKTHPFFGHTIV
jgi:hypothetical protein